MDFENSIELLYLFCFTINNNKINAKDDKENNNNKDNDNFSIKLIELIVKVEEKLLMNLEISNEDSFNKLKSTKLIKLSEVFIKFTLKILKSDKDPYSFKSNSNLFHKIAKMTFTSLERIIKHFVSDIYFPEFLKILDNKTCSNVLMNFLNSYSIIFKIALFNVRNILFNKINNI